MPLVIPLIKNVTRIKTRSAARERDRRGVTDNGIEGDSEVLLRIWCVCVEGWSLIDDPKEGRNGD